MLRPIARVCADEQLPQPMVFSESGRAMTAHHAVLITDVTEREVPHVGHDEAVDGDHDLLVQLHNLLGDEDDAGVAPQRLQHALRLLDEAHDAFASGAIDLRTRARAEDLFITVAEAIKRDLRLGSKRHRETLETVNMILAERVFGNFSLFQSLPDVWAIEQIFPLMPLHRLDESPDVAARVHDLTCDSDGCIDRYVDQDGVESTVMLHSPDPGEPYLLGIFLVGAYQEILGDMHNLFGDTDAVNVALDGRGGYRLAAPEFGDAVDELLRYVHFDPEQMRATYRERMAEHGLASEDAAKYLAMLDAGLHGYTYLRS